jgi:outer membrane protein assembly factor BamB
MSENEPESIDDEIEIVNLDEKAVTFSTWRKQTLTFFSRRKRLWTSIVSVIIGFTLLIAVLQIPSVKNRVWSQISGIPLDAISIQVKGREVLAQRTIDQTPLWNITLDSVLSGPPQIANDILYLRTDSGTFYAVQETSGSVLWRYRYQDFPIDQPVVVQGMIYVSSYTGSIRALRTADGAVLWHTSVQGLVTSSLLVSDNTLYFSRNQNTIVALRTADGAVLWHASAQGLVTSSLLVSDNTLYFTRNQNTIVALRTTNGAVLWQTQLQARNASDNLHATSKMLQVGDAIIDIDTTSTTTTSEKSLVALDKEGSILWSQAVNTFALRSILSSKANLYLLSANGEIVVYNSNGNRLWQHVLGNAYTLSMTLSDGVLYVNALDGGCIELKVQDGSQVAYFHSNIALASPVVSNHQIYITPNTAAGTGASISYQYSGIAAVSSANGSLLWKYFTLIPLSSPSVVGERVYAADLQGEVYTLDAKSGSLAWRS